MRNAAKRINFALLYGMAAFTLGKELGVSTAEAKSYVDSYFAKFPKVRACLDGILEGARRDREVTTLFGRVRPIPDIAASNPNVRGNAERMALNAPFQGSAADIIKIAMVRLDQELARRGGATKLLLQVHDELVLEAPEEDVEDVEALMRSVMEGAAPLRVRLVRAGRFRPGLALGQVTAAGDASQLIPRKASDRGSRPSRVSSPMAHRAGGASPSPTTPGDDRGRAILRQP